MQEIIIINGGMYEAESAVAAYIKLLEQNNLNLQEEFYKQGAKIDELKKENARLEELYQKSVGVIAATDCVKCKNDVALDYGISNNIAALRFVLDQYQKIIVEITHGRLSKLTYPAETILSIASEAATDWDKREKNKLIDELKTENEALHLLIEWAEECDFGYDNFPEEYERYKNEIEGMGYIEGMIHIAKRVYQRKSKKDGESE